MNQPVYFALGKGVVVDNIFVDDGENGIGGIVVTGEANGIAIGNNVRMYATTVLITNDQDELEWVSIPSSVTPTEDESTSALVGAYDGGQIHGDIHIGYFFSRSRRSCSFGCGHWRI